MRRHELWEGASTYRTFHVPDQTISSFYDFDRKVRERCWNVRLLAFRSREDCSESVVQECCSLTVQADTDSHLEYNVKSRKIPRVTSSEFDMTLPCLWLPLVCLKEEYPIT